MEKTIPNKLFDDAMKNQLFTEQYANGLSKKIQNLLTAAQDEIAGKIAKIDPTSPSMTKWKQARLEKLNEEISGIIDSTYKTIAIESKKQLTELGKVQSKLAVDKTNKAVKADIFKVTLTPDNVKSIVENTMIDGKVIGDWWANAKESTKTKLTAAMAAGTQALQIGMVQGESVGDLISRIRGTKTTPGIMSLTKREATALARTSVLQVANVTRQEVFKANEDVLDGIQFVATLDARTTPRCRAIDGKQYDMQGNPIGHNIPYPGAPPLHWNCFVDYKTPIYTTKGWKKIGELHTGDLVLTHKARFRKITELMFVPKQFPEVVGIRLKNRNSGWLSVTKDHPFLVNGNWIGAGQIQTGDKVLFLSHKCANEKCLNKVPYFDEYCSISCASLSQEYSEERKKKFSQSRKGKKAKQGTIQAMIRTRWTKENRERQSKMSSDQLLREYESGLRDKKKIVKKANEATRKIVLQGGHPFQRKEVNLLSRNLVWRRKVSERMKKQNPSFIPEVRERMTKTYKETMLQHPEKHPNAIMAKKGFVSSLEVKMMKILDMLCINYFHQYPIAQYWADFAIPELRIVIEVDGPYWHNDLDKDLTRQTNIENFGWQVIRFREPQINNAPETVYRELNRIFSNHEGRYEFADFEVEIQHKGARQKSRKIYNFSVEEDESYVAKGFVVHNCRTTIVPITKSWSELAGMKPPSNILLQPPTQFVDAKALNIEIEDYTTKGMHKDTVDFFKNRIESGEPIPPIYVEEGNISHIIDGNHRAMAFVNLGKDIPILEVPYGEAMQELAGVKGDFIKWYEKNLPKPTASKSFLKELDNIPVGLRSSMNGQVSGEMTYQDWLLTQSVEDQQAILGQGKWKLWSENKLDVADLVNNTGKELTLTELKANLGDILAKKQVELENQLKKLALESSSAEEFEKKLSEDRSIKFLKDKTPSQFYADTKQTVEAARAARAEAKFLEQKAEESYKAIFLKNPKIAKEAEEQMMKASPGFEKLPWAEKEKLLNSFVDAMKSPAVEEIITKHGWISVQDIKEAKKIFKKQLNVNKVLAKQTAIKKLDFVGESLNIIKNLPRFSNQALPELQEFHMVVEFIDESVRRNVVAFYQEQEGIVKIATKGIKSEDVLELGRLSLAGDIGSIARHEFAHHIYSKSLTAIEQSEWGDLFEARYYWSNVSKYSVVNMKEAFAESFTAYTSPLYGTAENRILPEEVEEYFARVFGKVGTVKTEAIAEKIVEKEELALISEKVERAKKSHIPATKEVQKLADGNQTLVAIKIKGTETPDNAPFDIILGKDHIELKTIVRASNDKITMHPSSLKRKNDFVAGVKDGKAHTLVIDERTGKVYYRSGVGSFRLSSMEEIGVKENFEKRLLKRLKQKQV